MSYLCIDEDGELRVAQGEPNEDVFQAVEEGVLTCVRWNKEADCFERLTVSSMESEPEDEPGEGELNVEHEVEIEWSSEWERIV